MSFELGQIYAAQVASPQLINVSKNDPSSKLMHACLLIVFFFYAHDIHGSMSFKLIEASM